jgi:hypothetical protein
MAQRARSTGAFRSPEMARYDDTPGGGGKVAGVVGPGGVVLGGAGPVR